MRNVTERSRPEDRAGAPPRAEPIALLANGVAHAFNNILQTIGAQSEILLSRLDPADPRREPVKEIRKAVHVGGDLTRELLELSRCHDLQERINELGEPSKEPEDGPS